MRRIGLSALLGFWLLALMAGPAAAVLPDEILKDPVLEARARAISTGLRCLVCQNETIDDSNAPLARDLRLLVRERLTAGDSDEEVVAYLVERYGDFVLLKPPFTARTFLLWAAPFALLAFTALYLLWARWSGSGPQRSPTALSVEEERRLKAALDRIDGGD